MVIKDQEIRQSLYRDIHYENVVNYDFLILMIRSALKVDISTAKVVFHKYILPSIQKLLQQGFIEYYKKYMSINNNDGWILKVSKRYHPLSYGSLFLLFQSKLSDFNKQSNLFYFIDENYSLYENKDDNLNLSPIEEMQLKNEDDFILQNYQIDLRKKASRNITIRQGQPEFRKKLIEIFDGKCVITECEFLPILEAAHILPYKGSHTNILSNGLLLRTDIHNLFDQGYIYIDYKSLKVHIAIELYKSEYNQIHQFRVIDPIKNRIRISRNALKIHQEWATSMHKFE
ncbi:HNH endonuclease [Herpetosiphon llansteffanensis]|uniref:HNH endonuclease n=1 Tax=Herpetosiphon llansteffanensis TaxID=2094568 RepID=UPI000D7BCF75|nr:HNH endonuclease signature motif containing protein [Herpetosiphon llansteffanensis]